MVAQLLVGRRVNDLQVELLFVVVGVDVVPVVELPRARGEADAVDVKGIELRVFGRRHFAEGYFPDLEVIFWMLQNLLFLFLSIYKAY